MEEGGVEEEGCLIQRSGYLREMVEEDGEEEE